MKKTGRSFTKIKKTNVLSGIKSSNSEESYGKTCLDDGKGKNVRAMFWLGTGKWDSVLADVHWSLSSSA